MQHRGDLLHVQSFQVVQREGCLEPTRQRQQRHARELAASVVRGRGYQALLLWVRFALLMAIVSFFAAVTGYMNLAVLLGAAAARGSDHPSAVRVASKACPSSST